MANPLVRQLGLQQVMQRDEADPKESETQSIFEQVPEPALIGHVRRAWETNKLAKTRVDMILLKCLRARRGVYSPDELAIKQQSGGVNIVWADLTETKCRAASAWIREIVLPTGERPWGLEPTPIPDLPFPLKKSIVDKSIEEAKEVMIQIAQAGGGVVASDEFRETVREIGEKLRTEAEQRVKKAARVRCERMEQQIEDRLAQGGWETAMDALVEDFVTYPAAILKGPIYKRRQRLTWGQGWKPKVVNEVVQSFCTVSPFDCYPAPGAANAQQGDFLERMRFRRDELHDLKGLPGYQDDQIDKALMDYTNGRMEGWLWTEAERQRLQDQSLYMWLSPPGVIDALNYWGSIPGWMLMSWGVKGIEDPTKDYQANILICGRYVLYAALNPNPLGSRPYRKACYDEIPGSFWGRSIPELAETSQKMCNALACAVADNVSMASGPMVWVHADRLADGEQSLDVVPWKVWQLKSDPTQGVNPGIGFFQPNMHADPLMKLYEQWELKADDATGIPRYTYGNENVGGAGDTATGLSMLMNAAAKGIRRAIGNIDLYIIAPAVYDVFVNEMVYNPDDSIKGDNIVVPKGASAILIKETAQKRRVEFLAMTANDIDMQIIGMTGRAAILREVASIMELPVDEVVPTTEELEERQQQQADAEKAAMQAEQQAMIQAKQMELQADAEKAAMQAQLREREGFQKIIGDVVKQALAEQAKRRVKMIEDKSGRIVAGELE